MKTILLTIASAFALNTYSQSPTIQWDNILGGNGQDYSAKTIQTTQGHYISVGVTTSTVGELPNYYGNWDSWITKTDANGNFVWKKTLGGSLDDHIFDVIQSNDNNFIACGFTNSSDGDLTSIPFSNDSSSLWIVKFDDNGTILWQIKTGGKGAFFNSKIIESPNGDLNIFTQSFAQSSIVPIHYGSPNKSDIVYFLLSSSGSIIQQKTFGGSEDECLADVSATNDGGFAVLTTSYSNDHDISNHIDSIYNPNSWVFKIDAIGNLQWEKSFINYSFGYDNRAIESLNNGNIIFTYAKDSLMQNTTTDGTVIMIDSQGNFIWKKDFGGSNYDIISEIVEYSPNEILLIGATGSNELIINSTNGGIWLVDIDMQGDIQWQNTYDFNGTYGAHFKATKTSDNGFILATSRQSINWGCCPDATNIKFSGLSVGIQENQLNNSTFSIFPNPTNDIIHINTSNSLINESYSIANTLGQTLLIGKLENERSTINVQTLPAGIYFLQLGNKQKQSYKIIKN